MSVFDGPKPVNSNQASLSAGFRLFTMEIRLTRLRQRLTK